MSIGRAKFTMTRIFRQILNKNQELDFSPINLCNGMNMEVGSQVPNLRQQASFIQRSMRGSGGWLIPKAIYFGVMDLLELLLGVQVRLRIANTGLRNYPTEKVNWENFSARQAKLALNTINTEMNTRHSAMRMLILNENMVRIGKVKLPLAFMKNYVHGVLTPVVVGRYLKFMNSVRLLTSR